MSCPFMEKNGGKVDPSMPNPHGGDINKLIAGLAGQNVAVRQALGQSGDTKVDGKDDRGENSSLVLVVLRTMKMCGALTATVGVGAFSVFIFFLISWTAELKSSSNQGFGEIVQARDLTDPKKVVDRVVDEWSTYNLGVVDSLSARWAMLQKPETWVSADTIRLWNLMSSALDATKVHFEDAPQPPLHKLIPVVRAHINYIRAERPGVARDSPEFWAAWAASGPGLTKRAERPLLKDFAYYSRFAQIAYESKDVIRSQVNQMGFQLLQWEPQVKYVEPSYFLAFSPENKLAILAIKGTSSLEDALTDIIHTPEKFGDAYAHLGIASAARFVQNRTAGIFESLLVPMGYDIVITGHSLAAGVASLLAVIFQQEMGIKTARCFAFAPPPTIEMKAANLADEYVWAMVHNDDIIPRWNFGTVASSFAIFEGYISQMDKEGLSVEEFYAQQDFETRMSDMQHVIESRAKKDSHRDMAVIGKILHFVDTEHDGYIWKQVPRTSRSLRRIELTSTALSDHAMDGYAGALDQAIDKLSRGANPKDECNVM